MSGGPGRLGRICYPKGHAINGQIPHPTIQESIPPNHWSPRKLFFHDDASNRRTMVRPLDDRYRWLFSQPPAIPSNLRGVAPGHVRLQGTSPWRLLLCVKNNLALEAVGGKQSAGGSGQFLVPTLCVGMHPRTLCVPSFILHPSSFILHPSSIPHPSPLTPAHTTPFQPCRVPGPAACCRIPTS